MATETLKRTPLYDRHVAAGPSSCPFAGWEMPVQYDGIKEEHLAVRSHAGIFDVSHMGEIETTGPDARGVPAAHPVQRRVEDRRARRAVQRAVQGGRRCPRRPLHLQARRATATSRSPTRPTTRRTSRGSPSRRRRSTSRSMTRCTTTRCSRSRAPRRAASSPSSPTGSCPSASAPPTLTVAGVADVLVCGTGYTGEDGVELLVRRDCATTIWDALLDAGVTPAGLGARDTLRLEVCYHLYGNDLMETRGPIEAGLGWCVKEDTGFIGARRSGSRATAARPSCSSRSSPSRASPVRATPSTAAARSRPAR